MASRLELHVILKGLTNNVYFQPPSNISMKYPAIIYSLNGIDNNFAGDNVYTQNYSYALTVIDKNPDSEIVTAISKLPTCRFDRSYTKDNLNHTVFTINY